MDPGVEAFLDDLGRYAPNQRELEAVLTALIVILESDGHTALDEIAFAEAVEDACEWTGSMGLPQFITKKRLEAATALEHPDTLDAYLTRTIDKLDSPDLHRPLHAFLEELLDGDARSERESVLRRLAAAFAE